MKWQWLVFALLVGAGIFLLMVNPATNPIFIEKFAEAIATAEGFYVPGSRPNRNNNPGDLIVDETGTGTGYDNEGFVIYATASDGWDALRHQVSLFFSGSKIYSPSMTIAEVAAKYTSTDAGNWAQIVAQKLGVSVSTQLSQLSA